MGLEESALWEGPSCEGQTMVQGEGLGERVGVDVGAAHGVDPTIVVAVLHYEWRSFGKSFCVFFSRVRAR